MIVPAPCSIRRGLSRLAAFLFVVLSASGGLVVKAGTPDMLSLGTGISATWDRLAQPLASPVIQLTVANDKSNSDAILYGITLSLSFEPVGGATGSLAVASVTNATSDPVFTTGIKQPPTINPYPLEGYTTISVENLADGNVPVPQTLAGLIGLTLSSTDAIGTFDIVVQPDISSWNNFDADEFAFANADHSPLTIGQITVTAVPEPSTLVLVAMAGGVALVAGVRRARSVSPAILQASGISAEAVGRGRKECSQSDRGE